MEQFELNPTTLPQLQQVIEPFGEDLDSFSLWALHPNTASQNIVGKLAIVSSFGRACLNIRENILMLKLLESIPKVDRYSGRLKFNLHENAFTSCKKRLRNPL
jgi:hypothetical protein